jgi:hypothetical protein
VPGAVTTLVWCLVRCPWWRAWWLWCWLTSCCRYEGVQWGSAGQVDFDYMFVCRHGCERGGMPLLLSCCWASLGALSCRIARIVFAPCLDDILGLSPGTSLTCLGVLLLLPPTCCFCSCCCCICDCSITPSVSCCRVMTRLLTRRWRRSLQCTLPDVVCCTLLVMQFAVHSAGRSLQCTLPMQLQCAVPNAVCSVICQMHSGDAVALHSA